MEKNSNKLSPIPHKFKIKLIGKSYVGKTSFIKGINSNKYSISHEKSNLPINYIVNFNCKYKKDIFYFEEEPEIDFDYITNIGITPPFYVKLANNKVDKVDYIALFFIYDVGDKESFDYVIKAFKVLYSSNPYLNIIKVFISNKNDIDEKLKQVKTQDVQNIIKQLGVQYFEISCRDSKQINDTIYKVYKKMKDIVKINEYFYGIDNGINTFIEKEKLMPNYYEISILGDKDSGKDCLKNKFLYDCCEKNIDLYEYCIPRTLNLNGKEIKFDINVLRETKDVNSQDFNSEYYYSTFNNLDANNICIILTYDISNNKSLENLKKITQELFDSSIRYKKVINILGMKCDLLQENELADKIREGRNLADLLNAHYYLVSNRTGYNVDRAFYDILVQAYNKYHPNDLIPTINIYKESRANDNIYSNIHVRSEKPKMKEKEKKKIEKQIEKELNNIKKMKMQKEQTLNNKKKKENELYSSQMKEILKVNYSKIFRCIKCWKIPKLQINDLNNIIKTKCVHNGKKIFQNYTIDEFLDIKSSLNEATLCSFCKGNNSNHPYSFDYCLNCQKIFCKKCESNHKNSAECKDNTDNNNNSSKNKVIPIYLMDSYCYTHDTPAKYYCINCKQYTCETCFEKEHKNHNFKYYKKSYVEELIKEKRQCIEREKTCYKFVQRCFNDCIKTLQNKFNQLMDLKMKKLNIKDNLIKDLELYKNNYTLIENVSNLKFNDLKFLKFNSFDTWKNKLNIIFDYLDEPLYIKNTNLCIKENIGRPYNILNELKKQNQEKKRKDKEIEKDNIKENKENKEKDNNLDKKVSAEIEQNKNLIDDLDSTLKIEQILMMDPKNSSMYSYDCSIEGNPDDILITDICSLSSKYFGISSDDGLLKIYNSYYYKDRPINTVKEYLPNKGIFSLYKPNKGLHLNFNPLYLVGFETIKKLIFNNEYTQYTINEEYTIKNCFYINMIELQNINGILISTLGQEISSLIYDNNKKLLKTDLTYIINDEKKGKEIVSIEEIGANKFNVKLKDEENEKDKEIKEEEDNINIEKQRLRKKTIGNKLRKNENDNIEENKKANKINIYNILVELEYEQKTGKISLKNKYQFFKNLDILGKVNSYSILVADKNIEGSTTLISLFDFSSNTFIRRFYLEQNIPILYHKIENWNQNDSMFLLLDNKMNLTQYLFENENSKDLKTLYSLDMKEIIVKKNKDDNIIFLNVGDKIFFFANNGLIFRINN